MLKSLMSDYIEHSGPVAVEIDLDAVYGVDVGIDVDVVCRKNSEATEQNIQEPSHDSSVTCTLLTYK